MSAYQLTARSAEPERPRRRNGAATKPKVEAPVAAPRLATRIIPRDEHGGGTCGCVMVRLPSGAEVDVTRTIVAAIAHELWQARGEDHVTNWLEAEQVFSQLAGIRKRSQNGSSTARVGRGDSARDDDDVLSSSSLRRSLRLRRL